MGVVGGPFTAYLLRCADGSFYVGQTDDLEQRLEQHRAGAFCGYTAARCPVVLAWSADFPTREGAFAAERQLKGWSRAKKEALIRGDWEAIRKQAKRRTPDDREER